MCNYVLVCVVFVVLLVASVLALMRWLLCGGDGSKKNDICNYRKIPRANFFYQYGFNQFNKIRPASNYDFLRILLIRKPIKSATRICVTIRADGSLLLRGSPQAPPTPLLSLRHFVIIGSRQVLGPHRTVAYNNVVCCL